MSEAVLTIARAAWVAWLHTLLGTPYHHQGRLPGVGLDCAGPLVCGAWHFGLKPRCFDVRGYSREPDGSLQSYLDAHLLRRQRPELQLGDVVLNGFRMAPPRHIALIVGEEHGQWVMLHACSRTGKVQLERLPYERRLYRYVQGYTVPGLA